MVHSVSSGKLGAPDGGWGWIVVFGVSLCNFSTRSMEPSFGLLFGDILKKLNVETTGAAIIMSIMEANINFSGFLVGPLMKLITFRKVAVFGSVLSSLGLLLTAPAASEIHIIVTYSIIKGVGSGLVWSSTLVALNHYFLRYRGQAVGYSMAGTAIGFLVIPHVVQLLLEAYEFSGAVLILSGICLNGLVGACLLQPVKWHNRLRGDEEKELRSKRRHKSKKMHHLIKVDAINKTSALKIKVEAYGDEIVELINIDSNKQLLDLTPKSVTSLTTQVDKMASLTTQDDKMASTTVQDDKMASTTIQDDKMASATIQDDKMASLTTQDERTSIWQRVVQIMDLDLLKDAVYLNIVLGICLFYVAEVNFKMLLPFFLADLGFSKSATAFCLSMMAAADILARVVLPPISDRINVKSRTIFVVSAVILGISRSIVATQTQYIPIIVTLGISGVFRGATLINSNLSISQHTRNLEKLPAAFGLQMVAKGFFIIILGPIIGAVRDISGSYVICIHAQTVLMFLCFLSWAVEALIKQR